MLEDCFDLLAGDSGKPLQKIINGRPSLKIFEKRFNRHARVLEHPGTAYFVGFSLNLRALCPIQHEYMICSQERPYKRREHDEAAAGRAVDRDFRRVRPS